jgi:hypothetical protein
MLTALVLFRRVNVDEEMTAAATWLSWWKMYWGANVMIDDQLRREHRDQVLPTYLK